MLVSCVVEMFNCSLWCKVQLLVINLHLWLFVMLRDGQSSNLKRGRMCLQVLWNKQLWSEIGWWPTVILNSG